MKKTLQLFFIVAQVGVIIFAVLITIIRLGVHNIGGYEASIENWFEEQGIHTEINQLFVRVDGFTPEFHINGLDIFDKNFKPLISLNTATLRLDLVQSILKQHIIIDRSEFYLKKAVIDASFLSKEENNNVAFKIPSEVVHSLLALKYFTLVVNQIDYVDTQNQVHSIFNSKISLFDDSDKKQISLSSFLFQKKLKLLSGQFLIDYEQFLEDTSLSGTGFVSLNIPSLNKANFPKNLSLKGDLRWQNWISFNGLNGQIISQIKTKKTQFNYKKKVHDLVMDSTFQIDFDEDKALLLLDSDVLKIDNTNLSLLKLTAQSKVKNGHFNDALLKLEEVAIEEIIKLMPTIPTLKSYSKLTSQIKPKGLVKELFFSTPSVKQWKNSKLAIKAQQLQWQAKDAIPAVNQLNINAVVNQHHFNAKLDSNSLSVLLGSLYTHPFKVDGLKATVNGQIDAKKLLVNAPSFKITRNNAQINGRASLAFEDNLSPYMFLRLKGTNANFKTVKPFLPQKLMDEDVLQWVTNSIKQAKVKTTHVLYSGRLENDVNFDVKNNGIFIAALDLKDVDLLYDKHWPNVKTKQAKLTFKNYQLDVLSHSGQSLDLSASDIKFSIANLDEGKADLTLKVNEPLNKQWGFLAKSPIKADIPYFSEVSGLKGSAKTSVRVRFPLTNISAKDVKFDVDLKTQKAGFELTSLGILLGDLSGDLNINQAGLTINPVTAKWYDQDITLEAKTNDDGVIQFAIKSNELDVKSLMHNLPTETAQHISGKSAWDINLLINQNYKNKPIVEITAHSGLKGTEIHLPLPFSLEKDEVNHFKVVLDIYEDNHIDVNLNLDHSFDVFSRLIKTENNYELQGTNVIFGDHTVSKKLSDGITLSGDIDEINLDHWMVYLESKDKKEEVNPLNQIESIDLKVKQLIVYGVEAQDTHLKFNTVENGLKGTINSSVAEGTIFVPIQQAKNASIEIDMEFIDIKLKESAGSDENRGYKTDAIPNVLLKSKKLAINGKDFSDAVLMIESYKENYFNLKALSVTHNKVSLNASGDWEHDVKTNEHFSKVNIKVTGKKFGQSLAQLGLGDGIENGKVSFNGDLSWSQPFWSMDLNNALGQGKFSLKDGYIKDVEPGGGRFVGLLSLSALPRRLTLDFSDFFKKGLQFDKIKGNFSIHDGSMWTDNLKMTGSVTDVKIAGRTGLIAKDYDQIITVIPQIRDTLPVLGSLISGSSVGWAMLLLQKVFEDPIDESVTIKYKVTGHWDNPQIEVIEKPKIKENEVEEYGEN